MSLQRHREIYPYDEGTTPLDRAPAHRLDESPAGYSWRGALQHGPLPLHQPALCCNQNQCRSTRKQRMANRGLTSCLSPGVQFSCYVLPWCVLRAGLRVERRSAGRGTATGHTWQYLIEAPIARAASAAGLRQAPRSRHLISERFLLRSSPL